MGGITLPPTIGEHDQSPPTIPSDAKEGETRRSPQGMQVGTITHHPSTAGEGGGRDQAPQRQRRGGATTSALPPKAPPAWGEGCAQPSQQTQGNTAAPPPQRERLLRPVLPPAPKGDRTG